MRSASRHLVTAIAALLLTVACMNEGKQVPSLVPPPVATGPSPKMDPSVVLKHKMECRKFGAELEKEQFPEGKNSIEGLNQGMHYFASEYAYAMSLNTCVMLSGHQLVDLKTQRKKVFSAGITDVLANKELAGYLVINGMSAPASTTDRDGFVRYARELFGEPLPKWLDEAPETGPQRR